MGYAYINPITWALAISLATFAGVWTFVSYKRRAWRSVLRGAALVVLPFGLLFTGSLTMLLRVLDAIALWGSQLAFSPLVWVGLLIVAVSAGAFVLAGRLPGGGSARKGRRESPPAVGPGRSTSTATDDDPLADMADIEAILRKRGIT